MTGRTALVIGAGGWLGRRLTCLLKAGGWRVVGLDRVSCAADGPAGGNLDHHVQGDRFDTATLARARAQCPDDVVIFDLVAYDAPAVAALLGVFAGHARRAVMLSTVSVYARLAAGRSDERAAVLGSAEGPGYQAGKIRAERVLRGAGRDGAFETVVLRSAPVFGAGDAASREAWLLRRLRAARPILHPGPTAGTALMVYVDDLVRAIVAASDAAAARDGIYHLAHADCPTLDRHAERIAALAGLDAPGWDIRPVADLIARGFRITAFPFACAPAQRLDVSAAERDLGLASTPWRQALGATLAEAAALVPWPGRASMQARLSGTEWRLHEALEAAVHAGWPAHAVEASAVFDAIEAAPGGALKALSETVAGARAPAFPVCPDAPAPSRVVVVPDDLAPPVTGSPGPYQIVASLVSGRGAGDTLSLFRWLGPDPAQDYAAGAPPETVLVAEFADVIPHLLEGDGPAMVLRVTGKRNRAAVRAWSGSLDLAGVLQSASLGGLARVRIPGRLSGRRGTACGWLDSFALARVLCRIPALREEARPAPEIRPNRVAAAPLLPLRYPWMPVRVGDRPLLVDIEAGRVLELDGRLALLIEIALQVATTTDCLAQFTRRSGMPASDARGAVVQGLATLSAACGVPLRGLAPAAGEQASSREPNAMETRG